MPETLPGQRNEMGMVWAQKARNILGGRKHAPLRNFENAISKDLDIDILAAVLVKLAAYM